MSTTLKDTDRLPSPCPYMKYLVFCYIQWILSITMTMVLKIIETTIIHHVQENLETTPIHDYNLEGH